MSCPCCVGLWSQIKRAPKAKRVRKTFETKGPKQEGSLPLDQRARQIFAYFKKYNYDVKDTGDVIRFTGNYKASRGQAAALTFYVFMGKQSHLCTRHDVSIMLCAELWPGCFEAHATLCLCCVAHVVQLLDLI